MLKNTSENTYFAGFIATILPYLIFVGDAYLNSYTVNNNEHEMARHNVIPRVTIHRGSAWCIIFLNSWNGDSIFVQITVCPIRHSLKSAMHPVKYYMFCYPLKKKYGKRDVRYDWNQWRIQGVAPRGGAHPIFATPKKNNEIKIINK